MRKSILVGVIILSVSFVGFSQVVGFFVDEGNGYIAAAVEAVEFYMADPTDAAVQQLAAFQLFMLWSLSRDNYKSAVGTVFMEEDQLRTLAVAYSAVVVDLARRAVETRDLELCAVALAVAENADAFISGVLYGQFSP